MTPEQYDAKKQAKVDYLEGKADQAQAQATALHSRAQDMASVIPFGQPILVGHHSERRDRNYRGRIESTFRKSFEVQNKAEYYARRAVSAASNRAIFSDDPAAGEKLEAKIERLEKQQKLMRAANKAIRKGDDEALLDLGFDEAKIALLKSPDFCGRIGFAGYSLTNNGANIRRLKQRLAQVSATQATPETEIEGTNARFEDCPAENRVRLFFPGKPSEEIRSRLKSAGFRWSPTIGAWQAYRHHGTIATAKKEAGIMDQPKQVERRTSERTGDAIWMKFECGAGSRWTSTTEDDDGTVCNFSGCNCGTLVRKVGETDDRAAGWFGLRVGAQDSATK